jgi:hypothetical protein
LEKVNAIEQLNADMNALKSGNWIEFLIRFYLKIEIKNFIKLYWLDVSIDADNIFKSEIRLT